ncbi:MAG TPA: hypothetical protein VGF67_13310 [Ktedonobacteraceae bacterium]|jgi:vacuolar-type H+-ATPase subunit I/STV1
MPTRAQLQMVWLLSDTVLYPEATAFMRHLIRDLQCNPLPPSQINGLLSIAEALQYDKLRAFVLHQRSRNWPSKQRDIKTFYTELEETLTRMQQRIRGDFRLVNETKRQSGEQKADELELMALLAREFIQHLIAENGLLSIGAQTHSQRNQQTGADRPTSYRPTGGRHGN